MSVVVLFATNIRLSLNDHYWMSKQESQDKGVFTKFCLPKFFIWVGRILSP